MEEAKPNGLWVDHLEIRNFRLFDHISIPAFGDVNLIVGKNNTGKTTLLEALCVLASRGAPQVLREIIAARDEGSQAYRGMDTPKELNRYPLINLFSRGAAVDQGLFITTGGSKLTIDFRRFREVSDEEGGARLEPVGAPAQEDIANLVPALVVRSDSTTRRIRLDRKPKVLPSGYSSPAPDIEQRWVFVSSSGISSSDIARFWDNVVLTELEDDVTSSLKLMCPEIERISMIGAGERTRSPRAKIAILEQPVPLKSLGEGVNRVFGMALALVNAKDGLLLIDEIENGIHYSVQQELWQFIMQLAHHLRVQVFATTHSLDCVKAFQLAAARSAKGVRAMLTRLEEQSGSLQVTQFSEDDLAIATREAIEVR